jgi:hypothetical protein
MTEKTRLLYYALWFAHPALQMGIVGVMLRRKLNRKFKFFFIYLCTQILLFALVLPTYKTHYQLAYYLYWTSSTLSSLLGFLVIHEAFLDVFRPFHTLRDLGTVLFKWAGLVMLLVAGVVSVSTTSNDLEPWMQAIVTAERCVRIIQVGIVLFLLFFSRYLGVSRRQYSFGIALGFGAYAGVELLIVASWVGNHVGNPWMSFLNMGFYNLSLLTWLGYSLAKSPAREGANTLLQSQRWEQSLTDIHYPLPENSLIPMFEGMVDRALSRNPGLSTLNDTPVQAQPEPLARGAAASAGPMSLAELVERVGSKP